MSRRPSWFPILLARCGCGAVFPAWPGRDRTGRCRDCRAAHDAGRLVEPEPADVWTAARCADWVAGYEYALRNWGDAGVQADLKLTPPGFVVPSRPSPTTGVRP